MEDLPTTDFRFVSANAGQGAYDSTTGIWVVGSLAAGGSTTLDLVLTSVVEFREEGCPNTAEVIASEQFDPDSVPNNNNPTEDDQSSAAVSCAQPAD